jgi:hypothetical protein
MYGIEELEKTFLLHHERAVVLKTALIKEFQDINPGVPIPDAFNDDFSLPLALHAMCVEFTQIRLLLVNANR